MKTAEETTLDAPPPSIEGQTTEIPDRWSDSMNELAELDTPEEKKSTPPPPVTPKKPAAKSEKQEVPVKPEVKKDEEKPVELDETKPIKASELRAHYDRVKGERDNYKAEIAKMRSEIEKRSKPVDDPEKKTLAEKLEREEKLRKDYEERIRLFDYRNSEEFKDKYWKPYQTALERAVDDLSDVTFNDAEGNPHKLDNGTILWLAGLRPAQAEAKSKEMFGDLSRLVTDRIDRIRNAASEMNGALSEHQKSASEQFKQHQEQTLEQQRRISKVWVDERKAWPERFPNIFSPKDGDEEGNKLLAKGYELVEQAFQPNGKPPEEMAKIHAEIYNKAAAFPRLALRLKRSNARIKELETMLAEYEDAEPPGGVGKGVKPDAPSDPFEEAMSEIDRLK